MARARAGRARARGLRPARVAREFRRPKSSKAPCRRRGHARHRNQDRAETCETGGEPRAWRVPFRQSWPRAPRRSEDRRSQSVRNRVYRQDAAGAYCASSGVRRPGEAPLARRSAGALNRRIRRGKPGRQFQALEGVIAACRRSGQGPVRCHGNPRRERAKLALAAQAGGAGAGMDPEIGGATRDVSGGRRRSPPKPSRLWRAACRAFGAVWHGRRDLRAGRTRLPSDPARPELAAGARPQNDARIVGRHGRASARA